MSDTALTYGSYSSDLTGNTSTYQTSGAYEAAVNNAHNNQSYMK